MHFKFISSIPTLQVFVLPQVIYSLCCQHRTLILYKRAHLFLPNAFGPLCPQIYCDEKSVIISATLPNDESIFKTDRKFVNNLCPEKIYIYSILCIFYQSSCSSQKLYKEYATHETNVDVYFLTIVLTPKFLQKYTEANIATVFELHLQKD